MPPRNPGPGLHAGSNVWFAIGLIVAAVGFPAVVIAGLYLGLIH